MTFKGPFQPKLFCDSVFTGKLLKVHEWPIPMCRDLSSCSRRPAWINRKIQTQLKHKKEVQRRKKQRWIV